MMKNKKNIKLYSMIKKKNLEQERVPFENFLKKINFFLGEDINLEYEKKILDLKHYFNYELLSDEEFIEQMYVLLLHRLADESGKKSKLDELKERKSRKKIVNEMQNSEEGKNFNKSYKMIGMDDYKLIDKSFFFKQHYEVEEFDLLIRFLEFKFRDFHFSGYIIDLLFYSGVDFVYLIYKTILGREPDFYGFIHNLSGVNLLHDKLVKIFEFAKSDEAKNKNIIIKDLDGENVQECKGINDINISEIDSDEFNKYANFVRIDLLDVIAFEKIFAFFDIRDVFQMVALTNDRIKAFNYILKNILNDNKLPIELLFSKDFIDLLKRNISILDYQYNVYSIDNELVARNYYINLTYYITEKSNYENRYIQQFNHNKIYRVLSKDMAMLIDIINESFINTTDMDSILKNIKNIREKLMLIQEFIKEYELSITELTKVTK